MKNIVVLFLLSVVLLSCNAQSDVHSHKEVLLLMGTRFEVTATAVDDNIARQAVQQGIGEIQRIEALISSWKEDSQTSKINQNAGVKPVTVDAELYRLIERSLKISSLTQGAFDISFASMDKLYTFDRQDHELPDSASLQAAIQKINYKNIILDPKDKSVFLEKQGMKIGFGAIGKGYAANQAKKVMSEIEGVVGGVVNASGDLVVWGENGKNEGWPIQISDPKDIDKSLGQLSIKNASVVTSGNYEKYFMHDDIRYAHIIDPRTGLPTTGIKSATIVSPDAEFGDALATAIFVMGPTQGMSLVNSLKNTEALIITDEDQVLTSKNLEFLKN